MKTILLPTDLTLQSLIPIHRIAAENKNGDCRILAVHMLQLPTSINDLLFIGRTNHYKRVPSTFTEAVELLCNKYKEQGVKLIFQVIYCESATYLKNFIRANNVDEVCLLDGYQYSAAFPDSADLKYVISKCREKVTKVPVQTEDVFSFQGLSALLQGKESYKADQMNHSTLSYHLNS